MKRYKYLIILAIIFGLFGCKSNSERDLVFEEFKNQIERNGMRIDSVDEIGLIYISRGELTLKISLDNLRRDYKRDKEISYVSEFVRTLVSYTIEMPSNWSDAKDDVYVSLFPNDYEFQDFIHHKVTDDFSKVYVHRRDDQFSWVTVDDLNKWNISQAELTSQASINADNLLLKTRIAVDTIDGHKLGLIEVEPASLKGALLFAPSMKESAKEAFGFPFYAVIPVRDFCYIFSENDFDFFSEKLGKVVTHEYRESGYPITTEILKFSHKGVEAVGRYPKK